MRLRIKSDGTPQGTLVVPVYDKHNHLVEGAPIRGIQRVIWSVGVNGGKAEAWIRVVDVDIEAQALGNIETTPVDVAAPEGPTATDVGGPMVGYMIRPSKPGAPHPFSWQAWCLWDSASGSADTFRQAEHDAEKWVGPAGWAAA